MGLLPGWGSPREGPVRASGGSEEGRRDAVSIPPGDLGAPLLSPLWSQACAGLEGAGAPCAP